MVQQGGAAGFRRTALGRASMHRIDCHRQVAVRTKVGTFVSAYGPAYRSSVAWMDNLMDWSAEVANDDHMRIFAGGDYNCKRAYEECVPMNASVYSVTKPTTTKNTAPTQTVTIGMAAEHVDTAFIPGVPHHGLVTGSVDIKTPKRQVTRMRRTAVFEADASAIPLPEELAEVRQEVDSACPRAGVLEPLPTQ